MKRFVMLGERNNKGQIAKNEQYSIKEFIDKTCITKATMETNISLFSRIFQWGRVKKSIEHGMEFNREVFEGRINQLIEQDNFGRSKTKWTKKKKKS